MVKIFSAVKQQFSSFAVRLGALTQWAGPYATLVQMVVIGLVALSISRLTLIVWQWDRVSVTGILGEILVQGVRADLILLGYFVAIAILFAPFLAHKKTFHFWRIFNLYLATLALVFIIFMELSTPPFMMQFDLRPNRLFIEYLSYPKEVLSTLWNGFRLALVLGVGFTIILGWSLYKLLQAATTSVAWSSKKLLLTWPLVFVLVFLQIRSTTDHRAANPALFALTGDALVNSLIINSGWSVLDALNSLRREAKSSEIYGELSREKVFQQVKSASWLSDYQFTSTELPTLHRQEPAIKREKPLNLVIVLEESLGATFVESLGGLPVTPELEKLKNEGWWFEQLYATGTRSVRGIEAVVAGYAPTPARSVVKLSLAQHNFYTLALGLGQQGYHTEFVYGGEAHFDNMRGFFTGNGFQQVVDRSDIQNPVFEGSWGASDEDLFNKSLERLKQLHSENKPFFSLIFSSSNHEPFEFPDGRIELHDATKQTVNNAVKYADYALGKFIADAKKQDYWKDTVFLIVADHDNRVYGDSLVPIHKFHIPGLILGADIEPKRIATIASQIDLGATLLSFMGVSSEHPMIGRDFVKDSESPGRAMMQFDNYFAWLEGSSATILRPNKSPILGQYNAEKGELVLHEDKPSEAQVEKAMAHVILPSLLYREQRYKLVK